MSLREVDQKILKQDDHGAVTYRFLQDFNRKINLFIWQKPVESGSEVIKFQFAQEGHILEWKTGSILKYGLVDEGNNPMGIKRSPIFMMSENLNPQFFQLILRYLRELQDDFENSDFIRRIFYTHELAGEAE